MTDKNLIIIGLGSVAAIGAALLIYNSHKVKTASGGPGNNPSGGIDETQQRINALLGNADFRYHLQTMKTGGQHGKPGSAQEQKDETYNYAVTPGTWYGTAPASPKDKGSYSYPGIPLGPAANTPTSSGNTGVSLPDVGSILTTAATFLI